MRGFCKWLPQRGEGSWHWEGSWEAILRVLQRQSWFTAWSAPQQSGLGFVLGAPGTTNGAHTFRLFSWFEHPSLFCAPPISISVPNATANKSNTATWDLSDIIDLTPAMSLKTFFFLLSNWLFTHSVWLWLLSNSWYDNNAKYYMAQFIVKFGIQGWLIFFMSDLTRGYF